MPFKGSILEILLITILLFSLLLDFDKKDAADIINTSSEPTEIGNDALDNYLAKKVKEEPEKFDPNNELNKIKKEFYSYVSKNKT